MNKTLPARVHLKVADLQLPIHKNFTSESLNRKNNSRDLLGKFWQDKIFSDRSKGRLLQSIGYQFPCAKLLKLWGIRENDECRLCKRLHPDVTPWPESLGHIQARCLALRNPRIAVHYSIWRELLTASVGAPWRPTTTARGNGTFRQRSGRPLMTNLESAKFLYI